MEGGTREGGRFQVVMKKRCTAHIYCTVANNSNLFDQFEICKFKTDGIEIHPCTCTHNLTPEQGRCENVWLVVFWLLCGSYLGMLMAWMELGGLLNRCMGVSDEFVRVCPWSWNMELKMWSGQYDCGRGERA